MNFTTTPPAGATGPTAVINAPTSAGVGEVVTFDGSGSQAGSSAIVSYEWNLGDGTPRLRAGRAIRLQLPRYAFNVSLTVVDGLGQSNTANSQITISAVADQPPTAAIQGPATADIGEQVTFSAAGSTAGSAPISKYIWNFGDGNTDETSEPTATTVYAQAGVYQVTVTVQDSQRAERQRQHADLGQRHLAGNGMAPERHDSGDVHQPDIRQRHAERLWRL